MSNTAVLNMRIDPKLKAELDRFAKEVGLPASQVVSSSIRETIRRGKIIYRFPSRGMTPEEEKVIGEVYDDIKHRRNLSPAFKTTEEMIAWLESDKDD
jgi:antitoxin component of RelBE/YafQ-DinJ toxin-antitoxin module